ncbi:hypothetical protein ACIGBL_07465 [Streptomyces sp. NPDC085614]|uniref:hypothetical protein n=1 Tax=Streptomyces sp. NPDC085614 TaxID=3365733 RepID=UPI0037CD0B40
MSQDNGVDGARRPRGRHASTRRGPGLPWVLGGGAVVGLGLLGAFVSGAFRSAPADGAAIPDGDRGGAPALIQPDVSGNGDDASDSGSVDGSGTGTPGTGATASSSAPASTTPKATATASALAGPGTTNASATATATADSDGRPGKSGVAPGATKRPK